MPATLALAEAREASGKDFLVAYALSFEIQNKLGLVFANVAVSQG